MLLPLRKKGLTSLFKEVRVFRGRPVIPQSEVLAKFFKAGILAVWILAPKLPNSDLKTAVDFLGGFFPPAFSKEKGPKKSTKKSTAKFTREFGRKNSPRISAEAFS